METNKKLERLLDAAEHPEKYPDVDIEKMLQDDECQEFYELMVRVNRVYMQHAPLDIERSLLAFEVKRRRNTLWTWSKMAAMFICALYFSCVSYANIRSYRSNAEEAPKYLRLPFYWGKHKDNHAVMQLLLIKNNNIIKSR
ncbi:MAG: hypothetical protein J6Y78_14500 [Paludibacteraceae bacterium]|nr:hypothetical protein [Paludibacteraceae bacterium]